MKKYKPGKLVSLLLIIIGIIIGSIYIVGKIPHEWQDKLGFGEYTTTITSKTIETNPSTNQAKVSETTTTEIHPAKTLWDWMVFLVGAIIGLIIAGINQINQERRKRTELEIANQARQESTLQGYFDKLSDLFANRERKSNLESLVEVIIGKRRKSNHLAFSRDIAQARTVTTLRVLDSERKGLLILFLHGLDLISGETPQISLAEAQLDGINLREAALAKVNFNRANLTGAQLRKIDLSDGNLQSAILERADLRDSNLKKTNLEWSNLRNAQLDHSFLFQAKLGWSQMQGAILRSAYLDSASLIKAQLQGADLREASLRGANFDEANLRDAKVTYEQLVQAKSLNRATLPDGREYNGQVDSKKPFEEV
jgi:uncharacterized protein YjbI with pentapeptide repeats